MQTPKNSTTDNAHTANANTDCTDTVDTIIAQWKHEGYASEKMMAMETIGRIKRLENLLMKKIVKNLQDSSGLQQWEFDVLATLRRSGKPYCLSPSELFAMTMVTSGTMTNRLHQLEKKKYIKRIENPDDKRSLLVKLTDTGIAIIEQAVNAHIDYENQLLAKMTSDELNKVNQIMKKIEKNLLSEP